MLVSAYESKIVICLSEWVSRSKLSLSLPLLPRSPLCKLGIILLIQGAHHFFAVGNIFQFIRSGHSYIPRNEYLHHYSRILRVYFMIRLS